MGTSTSSIVSGAANVWTTAAFMVLMTLLQERTPGWVEPFVDWRVRRDGTRCASDDVRLLDRIRAWGRVPGEGRAERAKVL
ncbi:hypothetical protein GCM10010488_13060 [Oerskovia jenensis]